MPEIICPFYLVPMKYKYITTFFFFVCWSLSVFAVQLDGVDYTVDTLQHIQVGPGSWYTSMRFMKVNEQTVNRRLDVYFLHVDASNPYIRFQTVLGRDSILMGEAPSSMAARKSDADNTFFAGTNGDFYITTGYVGLPTGGTLAASQLAYTPNNTRPVTAIDVANNFRIGTMQYEGFVVYGEDTCSISHVNHLRNENELVLYNRHNGRVTRTNAYGTEVLLDLVEGETWGVNKTLRARVVKVEKNVGSMAIPENQAVLSGHGEAQTYLDALETGAELTLTLRMTIDGVAAAYTDALGGDPRALMLKDGVVESNIDNIWNELHPRTGFGYTQSGDTAVFCVVDGRGLSAGCTTKVLAELMQRAGAYTAINWDGGGSSCMYVKEFGQVNTPSDGTERAVCNGFFAVSTAPEDKEITRIAAYEPRLELPRYGFVKPEFLGYNRYGLLLDTDLQGVKLSCAPEVGEILEDGTFLASGSEGGIITATFQENITTQITVTLISDMDIAIRLDSVLMDNRRDYEMEVLGLAGSDTLDILSKAFEWEVRNPDVCVVEDGVIHARNNGSTYVVGRMSADAEPDSLKVCVEIPETTPYAWSSFAAEEDWTLTSSSGFNPQIVYSDDASAILHFTYEVGRAPFLKLERETTLYGLPDSVRLEINAGNVALKNIIVGMRANNRPVSQTGTWTFTDIPKQQDVVLSIPIDQMYADWPDFAIYPIWLKYITLNLDAGGMTSNMEYDIVLNGLSLCYNGLEITYLNPVRQSSLRVYPNPVVQDMLYITGFDVSAGQLCLFDLQGRLLKRQTIRGNAATLDISGLGSGTYLLCLDDETVKIVKM